MDVLATHLLGLITIILCLITAGFFSCAETAVTSLDPLKVKHILSSRGEGARSLRLWADHPERVLATILIYNNVVNILASSIATSMAMNIFASRAVGIATGIMTLLILVFGEIIPKSYAKTHAEPVAITTMWVITFIYRVSSPIVRLFSGLAQWILNSLSKSAKPPDVTEEQLGFMVNEGHRSGALKGMKKDIMEGALEFDETRVGEIITPRTSIKCLPEDASYDEALMLAIESGYSRIPIYKNSLDEITGIVLIKDLIAATRGGVKASSIKVRDAMRKPFFAPSSKTIMQLFVDLKKTKNHMAIIIDEYGGTAGLVTMEDILEEIVGEIQDEHDEEGPAFVKIDEQTFEVDGATDLEDFLEFFHIPPFNHEADTLSGWITHITHEMPKIGQTVEYPPLTLQITDVSQHRIKRVKVIRLAEKHAAAK